MKPVIFAAFSALVLLGPAHAQEETVCMTSHELEAGLIDWYGEAPVAEEADGTRQLWAAGRGGTWTVVNYEQNGQACVLAQGDNYSPSNSSDALVALLR